MSLTTSLNIAKSALSTISAQTEVVSRNVAGAGEAGYVRRSAYAVTAPGGGIQLPSIRRDQDLLLFNRLLNVNGSQAGHAALADGLERLEAIYDDAIHGQSPAALIGELEDALQLYANAPHDGLLAASAVDKAVRVADGLNAATATVQQVRAEADADIAQSVERINSLLAQFEEINTAIVTSRDDDPARNEFLDTRDRLLDQISQEIGIKTVMRGDDDVVIYTDSGVTLFEKVARDVSFVPTNIFEASTVGGQVMVDGVVVTGDSATMPISSGRLTGLVRLRDEIAGSVQSQLDETARGLIEVFAESDQTVPPALPDAAGLFTYSGAPAVPPSGVLVTGLAGEITINASVDPRQGGNVLLLRDGGISDPGNPAYDYNPSGAAGYSERLREVIGALNSARSFDPAAGLESDTSVGGFSASAVGWLAEVRQEVQADTDYHNALKERTSLALSHRTGVNVDEEMTHLLELERSYQASARLVTAVDAMFASLLAAVA
jgi:flagellar hook-associated protein 1 FlgK